MTLRLCCCVLGSSESTMSNKRTQFREDLLIEQTAYRWNTIADTRMPLGFRSLCQIRCRDRCYQANINKL